MTAEDDAIAPLNYVEADVPEHVAKGRVEPSYRSCSALVKKTGLLAVLLAVIYLLCFVSSPRPTAPIRADLLLDHTTILASSTSIEETKEWKMCTKKAAPGRNAGECNMLQLANRGLKGSIPEAITKIKNLQTVDLSGNDLTGPLPGFGVYKGQNMQILKLNDNHLTGSIPGTWGKMTGCAMLNVSNNQLTGSLPPAFSANNGIRSDIKHIDFSYNQLSGPIPVGKNGIGHFDNLKSLRMDHNKFTKLPGLTKSISQLDVTYCDMTNNKFSAPPSCQGRT